MRSYDQYCSIARALDVIGDRWTLLIVRELLLQGPCRFTDLKNGLPGVATNMLSGRLRELEQTGLITRYDAPPPVASVLYELTQDGADLEPVLKQIGLWGLRRMAEDRADDTFQASWLAYAPAWFTTDADPDGPPATIQLVAGEQKAVIALEAGRVRTWVGDVERPDLVIDGPPRAVLGLVIGMTDLKAAKALGSTIRGKRQLLQRLRPLATTPEAD
ncbi:winged helix-turn-helix transcriptional regulator [Kribbella sp. NPDC004536]|uniref:winged helix-turn-helix transcriptional regulator n=1 Tax=Kribbella sp. NPDC004536 TaxID=3364106 RepID=UPI0036D09CB9